MKVIIAAGGTGGHIIPAISIAKELIKEGVDILFVGNKNSMEKRLAEENSLAFKEINVQKFYRKFTFAHFKFPFKLIKSVLRSKQIIKRFQPDLFLGTGGFVSGPVGYAAHLLKVPIFLQEQNSYPGATTKLLSKYAEKVFVGNHNAEKHLKNKNVIYTGNPINQNAVQEKDKINFNELGLTEDTRKVFLFGGSQGSYVLNKAFFPIIDDLLEKGYEIIWQIGKYSYKEFREKLQNMKGIYAFDFTSEIGKIYNSVDLAIARAGALSLAELETKRIPSILIPLPSAAENHQYHNALELENKNVARVIEQRSLNSDILKKNVLEMLENIDELKNNFSDTLHANAAKNIAATMLNHFV